jgi:integrase/recombinase XerD
MAVVLETFRQADSRRRKQISDQDQRRKRISPANGPIIRSVRGQALRPNSVVNWFVAMFRELGVEGCSSHSGRRTFITAAARRAHQAGCSLRDVQLLAGHRSIEVTQGYIELLPENRTLTEATI